MRGTRLNQRVRLNGIATTGNVPFYMLVAGGTTTLVWPCYALFPNSQAPTHPDKYYRYQNAIPKPLSFHIIYLFSFTVKEYVNKRYSAVFGKSKSIEYDDILDNTCWIA